MKTHFILIAVLIAATSAMSFAGGVEIALKQEAVISGSELRLEHVANVTGDDAQLVETVRGALLGPAPWPGNSRRVTRDELAMCLRKDGLDAAAMKWSGAQSCMVTLHTLRIKGEEIVAAAREYLSSLPVMRGAEARFDMAETPRDKLVPAGARNVTFEASSPSVDRPWGKIRVHVKVLGDGELLATVPVTFNISSKRKAYVANTSLRPGDTILASHLEEQQVELGPLNQGEMVISDPAQLIGKKVLTSISSGGVFKTGVVAEPMLVRKGESVTVCMRAAGLEVIARGTAMADGRLGDVAPITVLMSGKKLVGIVTGSGEVEVAL